MARFRKKPIPRKIANFFGAFGYVNISFQWLWCLLPLLLALVDNDTVQRLIFPAQPVSSTPTPTTGFALPSFVEIIIMIVAVVFALALTIYAMYLIPKSIGKTGQRITQKSATAVIPLITHKRKLSNKKRAKLQLQVSWSLKLALVLLPAFISLVVQPHRLQLDHTVFLAMGLAMMAWSLVLFGIQFGIMKIAKLDPKNIW